MKYERGMHPNSINALNSYKSPKMEQHPRWKGGKIVDGNGYIKIRIGGGERYKPEHRIIMEKEIGRKLLSSELVHHKNGNRKDNRIENLLLVTKRTHKTNDLAYFEYSCPYCHNTVGVKH